ncbi:hypothetical protein [Nostoc foliaceum]|uniref:Uncharacterized protein n=2 Tax=Nostoc TaxID=1177 RepID=A0ABR8I388_9NOSO|nr:hypothetical protein [Nostoc foliaceum]MBD2561249.1 hypothetical protein [Nostoc linckia FACHB-391]MBD2646012.1 hypothetical protein [Nostoc foliaceum FACHB-393]
MTTVITMLSVAQFWIMLPMALGTYRCISDCFAACINGGKGFFFWFYKLSQLVLKSVALQIQY